MKKITKFLVITFILTVSCITMISCEDGLDGVDGKDGINGQDGNDGEDGKDFTSISDTEMFSDKSIVEPLVTIAPTFSNVRAYSLTSSVDVIGDSKFQIASTVDGAGLIKDNNSDGFIYVVNCEDAKGIARMFLDKNLNPISGDYLLNSGVADYSRQCSATMWEKEIHGGTKDVFLSASEESMSHVVKELDPRVITPNPTGDYGNRALGQFLWENAVPLPKDTYPGKTVIVGGDDHSDGQFILYYSENGDADRTNGKVYVLRFKEISDGRGGKKMVDPTVKYDESSLDINITYDIEFVEIADAKNKTIAETHAEINNVKASAFIRMEDLDYQKGSADNARNVYFAVTGLGYSRGSVNDWGTVYKLELAKDNPLKGKLTRIISGNVNTNAKDGNLRDLQSPDNICVTENYVYIQEDPNTFDKGHSAYIYQSDLTGATINKLLELKIDPSLTKDNAFSIDGSGEFGALIDVSDKVGVEGTFILNLQVKYWQNDKFKGLDGHDGPGESDRASQIVILRNLPK